MSQSVFQPRLIALALGCVSLSATAQTVTTQLDPVVVVGERAAPLSETLASVTVIDRAQIEAAHANDIAELLQGQAGVEISRAGPPGSPVSVFMRGGSSAQTLILLDGIPFNSQGAIGATTPLELIPIDTVEKIEIRRGLAVNAQGWSGASGVISITTRLASGPDRTEYSMTAGSNNTFGLNVMNRKNYEDWSIGLMAGRQYSSGINATYPRYANANPGLNPSLGSHALLTLSKSFSINDQVGISLKSIRQEASYDDARFGQPTQSYLNRSRSGFLKIQGDHQLRSNWSTQWQMSRSDVDQFDLMDETVNSVNRTVRTSLGWNNEFQIDSTLAATFALSRDWVVADTSAPFYKGAGHSRWLIGATKKFGPTTVDGNVSKSTLDAGSSFNDYLLGVGHQLMQSWTIFATVGQTHQMPTVGQLYHIDWGGNPNLKTETIKSNEIGIQFKDNTDLVRVVSYRAMYRDKLLSDASTGFIWENVGSAHDAGIEFSWRRMKPKWTVQATATFHQPQLDDSATPIEKTSKATFSANATYVLNHRDSLNYVLFGRSSQFSSDPIRRRTEVGGYGLSKLGWTRRWSKHQRSVVTVDNLFNKTYQEVAGYQTNNRTIFLNFVLQY